MLIAIFAVINFAVDAWTRENSKFKSTAKMNACSTS